MVAGRRRCRPGRPDRVTDRQRHRGHLREPRAAQRRPTVVGECRVVFRPRPLHRGPDHRARRPSARRGSGGERAGAGARPRRRRGAPHHLGRAAAGHQHRRGDRLDRQRQRGVRRGPDLRRRLSGESAEPGRRVQHRRDRTPPRSGDGPRRRAHRPHHRDRARRRRVAGRQPARRRGGHPQHPGTVGARPRGRVAAPGHGAGAQPGEGGAHRARGHRQRQGQLRDRPGRQRAQRAGVVGCHPRHRRRCRVRWGRRPGAGRPVVRSVGHRARRAGGGRDPRSPHHRLARGEVGEPHGASNGPSPIRP